MSTILSDPNFVRKLQIISLILLVGGAIGLVGANVAWTGVDSDYTQELVNDLKLVVIAGVLAAFALTGLGRRASTDK